MDLDTTVKVLMDLDTKTIKVLNRHEALELVDRLKELGNEMGKELRNMEERLYKEEGAYTLERIMALKAPGKDVIDPITHKKTIFYSVLNVAVRGLMEEDGILMDE